MDKNTIIVIRDEADLKRIGAESLMKTSTTEARRNFWYGQYMAYVDVMTKLNRMLEEESKAEFVSYLERKGYHAKEGSVKVHAGFMEADIVEADCFIEDFTHIENTVDGHSNVDGMHVELTFTDYKKNT